MTRSELIASIAESYKTLTPDQIGEVICQLFEDIAQALVQGNRIELRGFGSFFVRYRKPRMGRNPRTGNLTKVNQKAVALFKISKNLHQLINR